MNASIKVIGALFLTMVMISPAVLGDTWPPSSYKPGDEKDKLGGHAFTDEMWTTDFSNTSTDGTKYTFSASYVNANNVQAFLVAFKTAEKNGTVSTLPYQFFGMHYYTPGGREVFLGAVFAFLMAYNDTHNGTALGQNGVPDPGNEPVYYIVPFGVGDLPMFKNDTSYKPEVSAINVVKNGEGDYTFGISYKNLYAKVIDGNSQLGFWLSLAFPVYIAKFSELTVSYRVKMDKANKIVTSETFYKIGQVSKLWIAGKSVDPKLLNPNWGIAAVHFVTMFVSQYTSVDNTNQTIGTLQSGASKRVTGVTMRVGSEERAFNIGLRGSFNLIDELNGNTAIKSNQPALNLVVGARASDLILVAWQGGLSAGLMSIFGYALSKQIQTDYTSPYDLYTRGGAKFWGGAFWYAVCFPQWNSYRVEHDPVYSAYTGFSAGPLTPVKNKICGGSIIILGVAVAGLSGATTYGVRRKKLQN